MVPKACRKVQQMMTQEAAALAIIIMRPPINLPVFTSAKTALVIPLVFPKPTFHTCAKRDD